MIRNSIVRTIAATFVIRIPEPTAHDFPVPRGTGFFVSPQGHFMTAFHVIEKATDPDKIIISHDAEVGPGAFLRSPEVVETWQDFDLALLKLNFESHKDQELLKEKKGFDFLEVDFAQHYEGTPVYSFGYPLPKIQVQARQGLVVGLDWICPRVSSAIIASRYEAIGPIMTSGPPYHYVLDRPFNYGNSGGPIVVQETGKAIAAVVRFQPVQVPQPSGSSVGVVTVPSEYGIASSLRNIENILRQVVPSLN